MLLDPQRLLLIGMPAEVIPARTFKFFDPFDVDDFDLMAWNAESLVVEMQKKTDNLFKAITILLSIDNLKHCTMRK